MLGGAAACPCVWYPAHPPLFDHWNFMPAARSTNGPLSPVAADATLVVPFLSLVGPPRYCDHRGGSFCLPAPPGSTIWSE